VGVQEELGDAVGSEIHMYSISLDGDSPADLREYAEIYGVQPGWTFLTGDQEEITEIRHKLGAFDPDPIIDRDKTQHAGIVVYGDDMKGRWCAFPGQMKSRSLARYIKRVMRL